MPVSPRVTWVKIQGHHYSQGDIIVLRIEEEMPVFGWIAEVYVYEAYKVLFLTEELTTVRLNHHYHAFEVSEPEETVKRFVPSTDLHDPVPLNITTCCKPELIRTRFISTRYNLL